MLLPGYTSFSHVFFYLKCRKCVRFGPVSTSIVYQFSPNICHLEWTSMKRISLMGFDSVFPKIGDFTPKYIVCALVHALFRPQTKTHFEDTFLSGRVRERRREDTFRRHIKRRRISPRRRITPRRHISKTH